MRHLTREELEAGLDVIRQSPAVEGVLRLIVRRPAVDVREVLTRAELNLEEGVAGDTWRVRSSKRTADGSAHPDMQLNVMNVRAIALIAQSEERWPLAGDQLYVDLDLSARNAPAGTRFAIGTSVIEVSSQPHLGCPKFVARFGKPAVEFVNSPLGCELRLRGLNARVVAAGTITVGDVVQKLPAGSGLRA
jgi:hypothetical protein